MEKLDSKKVIGNMNNCAFSKILILVVVVVLAGGGILAWQYFKVAEEEVEPLGEEALRIVLNIDNLLKRTFPGYEVKNGEIKILKKDIVLPQVVADIRISVYEGLKENPLFLDENRILLITRMKGFFRPPYRFFLSVFDTEGNLLTTSFYIPRLVDERNLVDFLDKNFQKEDGVFIGGRVPPPEGYFFFYNCRETKYILFNQKFCVVGWCWGGANLHKIEGNKFVNVQKLDLVIIEDIRKKIMVFSKEDKIRIYREKYVSAGVNFVCLPGKCLLWPLREVVEEKTIIEGPERFYIFYKDLFWNNKTCRFE